VKDGALSAVSIMVNLEKDLRQENKKEKRGERIIYRPIIENKYKNKQNDNLFGITMESRKEWRRKV
jgi:hypothetical protein